MDTASIGRLSHWERRPSAARTERENKAASPSQSSAVTALQKGEPRLSKNYDMQLCDRAAGNGPGQLLLPFGQFTFRVKGAKSPLRVQSSRFLNFLKFKNLDGSGAKSLFRYADAPIPTGIGAFCMEMIL